MHGQLYYPASAVKKILELLQAGESFVLFSDNAEHVRMIETLVRDAAKKQGMVLEDPSVFNAGDLCLWKGNTEVILHHRTPDVYRFLGQLRDERGNEYVDICDLQIVTASAYRCDGCGKGEATVSWREQPQKKFCRHCFWLWDLEYGDE
jgi:hypothetical protein